MLQEYPSTKNSKRCHVSGQEFAPGESYISVLVPAGEDIARIDIAASQWQDPPENAIGWWRCRMPAAERRGLRPAPNNVLLDTLTELLHRPDKASLAYLLALLLVRRRVLAEEQRLELEDATQSDNLLCLVQPTDGRQWQVPVCLPEPPEMAGLQESLMKLLFTDE